MGKLRPKTGKSLENFSKELSMIAEKNDFEENKDVFTNRAATGSIGESLVKSNLKYFLVIIIVSCFILTYIYPQE